MNRVRNMFTLYAMLAIFVLLTLLLGIINGVNFTMAAGDADEITHLLSMNRGAFGGALPGGFERDDGIPGHRGPMGPGSPEVSFSVRYFTYAFDRNGNARRVSFAISAVTEAEAEAWARSLSRERGTGWTRTTYRYRVYEDGGSTYVTVIDQGRELLPSYRILIISICGEVLGLVLSFLVLFFVSRRLFRPLEDADRRQKQFLADVEQRFKVPLTVISADTELLERANGPCGETQSINRQVRTMTALVKDLGALSVLDAGETDSAELNLSDMLRAAVDDYTPKFTEKGMTLMAEIEDGVTLRGDGDALYRLVRELLENALKFGRTGATVSLKRENGRVVLRQSNGTELTDRSADHVFDRFTRLENAQNVPGAGLGLSFVKDVVKAHNGRLRAEVAGGAFSLTINF